MQGTLTQRKPVPRCEPPLTTSQRAYLAAFDRFLAATGPAKLAARHDMRVGLSAMCQDAGVRLGRGSRARDRFGPRHDR